jgi:hypothetical protein
VREVRDLLRRHADHGTRPVARGQPLAAVVQTPPPTSPEKSSRPVDRYLIDYAAT